MCSRLAWPVTGHVTGPRRHGILPMRSALAPTTVLLVCSLIAVSIIATPHPMSPGTVCGPSPKNNLQASQTSRSVVIRSGIRPSLSAIR